MVKSKIRKEALKHGYASGLEHIIASMLDDLGIPYEYEKHKIKYEIHTQNSYTPDFLIKGIYFESKGLFTVKDRMKHRYIKEQHPDIRIVLIFQNSRAKINKGSKTTYADYCKKYSLEYIDFKEFKEVITKEIV